jgi:hypothetical protein
MDTEGNNHGLKFSGGAFELPQAWSEDYVHPAGTMSWSYSLLMLRYKKKLHEVFPLRMPT